MSKQSTRRQFLSRGAAMAAGLGLSPLATRELFAADSTDSLYTIALSQYSLHRMLKKGELDVMDYPDFAKKTFGIDMIDLWNGSFPEEKLASESFYKELRGRSTDAGTDLFLLMIGPLDTASKDAAKRAKAVDAAKPWFDRAALLGCKYVRIFLKAGGKSPDEARALAVESLRQLSDYAQSRDLTIVIEPGASDLARQGDWLASVFKELGHARCKAMPDFGKFGNYDAYEGTKALMPYTAVVSAKSHDFNEQGLETHIDYPRIMKIIVDSGFRGPVAIEFEGSKMSEVDGVLATQKLLERIRKSLAT
ncbi:Xylose isomerase-like TIM barrel [Planctomycetes bacterium Pan216]|uniref:Xylose isomerase-like TIM barrel n=1 Tax=Kolteria novifilia TaxID=2527975 RepID=A0A518B376_9BACT|nr:Xylose isomerase-like TIM barrel [Planctomycetes bacterium Pan216]